MSGEELVTESSTQWSERCNIKPGQDVVLPRTALSRDFLATRFQHLLLCLVVTLAWAAEATLKAQSTGWQSVTDSNGVEISFIAYRYGDGENAGVVLRLVNTNQARASYRFRAIFRSNGREWISDVVSGTLEPLEVRTGEMSGLWWIPFKDGTPVTEVGLKGLRVEVALAADQVNGSGTTL